MFFGIDVQTSDIVVVLCVELLGLFEFVQDDAACCCVVNDFIVAVVPQVGSGVITSVPVNVVHVQSLVGWVASLDHWLIRHVLDGAFPARSGIGLIPSFVLLHKLIFFSRSLMIHRLFLPLNFFLSRKPQRLHPKTAMVIIHQKRPELIQPDTLIFVVIILLELLLSDLVIVLLLDQVHELQVVKNCLEETLKQFPFKFLLVGLEKVEQELLGFFVVLMQ